MALEFISASTLSNIDTETQPITGSVTVPADATFAVLLPSWGHYSTLPPVGTSTLGGVSLSSEGASSTGTLGGFPTGIGIWSIDAPLTGSRTLTIPFTGFSPYTSSGTLAYFKGEADSAITEGYNTASGTGTTATVAPTTTTEAGDILVGILIANLAGTANFASNDQQIDEINLSNAADFVSGTAYRVLTGSGESLSWTLTSSVGWRAVCVVIKAAAATGFEIDAQDGAFTFTGTAATLLKASAVSADTGTFSVTGSNATLALGRVVNAETGTFTYTGADAGLIADRTVNAESVTYSVTGADTDLVYTTAGDFEINAEPTSFSVTGADTTLLADRNLNAETTSYSVTGSDAELLQETPGAYTLNAESGSYTVTGSNAGLVGVTTPTFGGGIGHSSKPKRYYIERDGKRIFFTDERQVYDLLHQEEKRVVKKAKKAIKRVTKAEVAELISFKDLDIPKPKIVMHFNDVAINKDIDKINARIQDNYFKALMRHIEEMEEDEMFLELLFH